MKGVGVGMGVGGVLRGGICSSGGGESDDENSNNRRMRKEEEEEWGGERKRRSMTLGRVRGWWRAFGRW